jgi:5-hydroxyisourate hydrolase-like protein (transthyretin family)
MEFNKKVIVGQLRKLCFSIAVLFLLTGLHLNAEILSNVYGEVIDGETGEPVKGVKVCLFKINKWAETDVNGKFCIYEVPAGKEVIGFYPPSPYAYEKTENFEEPILIPHGKNLHIFKKLKYGGVLEMEMYDIPSNSPLEDVFVNIIGAALHLQNLISESYSDKNGKFRLDRLSPGKYTVILRKDGYGMKILPGIEIQAKQMTSLRVNFDSTSPPRVSGRVICKNSSVPLNDVLVSVDRIDEYGWSYAYTDEDGCYSMFDLEPGIYSITIFGLKEKNGEKEKFKITKKILITKDYPTRVNFTVDCIFAYEKKSRK